MPRALAVALFMGSGPGSLLEALDATEGGDRRDGRDGALELELFAIPRLRGGGGGGMAPRGLVPLLLLPPSTSKLLLLVAGTLLLEVSSAFSRGGGGREGGA